MRRNIGLVLLNKMSSIIDGELPEDLVEMIPKITDNDTTRSIAVYNMSKLLEAFRTNYQDAIDNDEYIQISAVIEVFKSIAYKLSDKGRYGV